MNRALLTILLPLLLVAQFSRAEEDPIEPIAGLVALERPDQPLDMVAPPSQFTPFKGEEIWKRARERAINIAPEQGAGMFDISALLGEGFQSAKNFRAEKYADGSSGSELQLVIGADEAAKTGKKIVLTRMRVILFVGSTPLALPGKSKEDPQHSPKPPKPKAGPALALSETLPAGSHLVITAPHAEIDLITNEGRASGNVTIEVFGRQQPGKPREPMAVLASERLNWRTWSEPALGSTELAVYTCSDDPREADPLVSGRYTVQTDGVASTVVVQGRGMVFESSSLDRPTPVYDEEGRTLGLSAVGRNRAIFRSHIQLETTAATMSALMPFQPPPPDAPEKKKKKAPPAVDPTRTLVTCAGPALFDLAATPRRKVSTADDPALKEISLGRRLEFLNEVRLIKKPLNEEEKKEVDTELFCKHLCLQYPPDSMPDTSTFPEYAEAIGGVSMRGMQPAPANANQPAAAPTPFGVDCSRIYYDGVTENMFLVGTDAKPVTVRNAQGGASAQQFNYRHSSQTLTMPSKGPKQLVIAASTASQQAPPAAESLFNVGGETIISWKGTLTREIKRLPVPQQADRVKEVLTLKDDVRILQPKGGFKMAGEVVRVIRTLPSGDVEFLEGLGAVDVAMGELQAKGEVVSAEMKFGPGGELLENLITVSGSRKADAHATLFMAGSAVRAEKFVVDRKNDKFQAFGGAIAVVKSQALGNTDNKPQAAQDAGALFKGINLSQGGNIWMQCDGEFSQDGATRKVTIRKNVLIRQPGLQLLADEVVLTLDDPPQEANLPPGATPANALFSGKLRSIVCSGNVELTTEDQLVQCDRLAHDVKDEISELLMDDAENDVRIYMREESGKTRVISSQRSLRLDGKSGQFKPGGAFFMLPYRDEGPRPRGKDNSPVRKKQ